MPKNQEGEDVAAKVSIRAELVDEVLKEIAGPKF